MTPSSQAAEKAEAKRVLQEGRTKEHGLQLGAIVKARKAAGRTTLREVLIEHYTTDEGQAEIARAPQWLRDKPVEDIVDALMKSLPKEV